MASSYTYDLQFNYRNGKETAKLTIAITAHTDGSVTGFGTNDMTYFDGENYTRKLKGFNMISVDTFPGAGADAPTAYTVDILDDTTPALTVVDIPARSTSAAERFIVSNTTGYWDDADCEYNFTIGNLGASNKTTVVCNFKQD